MLHLSQASIAARLVGRPTLHRVRFDTFARRRAFGDPACARRAVEGLAARKSSSQPNVLAWVLLPDRWSGVVAATPAFPLGDSVAALKAALADGWSRTATPNDPLWATGFSAQALADDAALARAVESVLLDPVAAGLARLRGDYPYWDAVWLDRVAARRDVPAETG